MITFSTSPLQSLTLSHAHTVESPRSLHSITLSYLLTTLSQSLTISTLMISPSHPFTTSLPHPLTTSLSLSHCCSNSIFTLKLVLSFSHTSSTILHSLTLSFSH